MVLILSRLGLLHYTGLRRRNYSVFIPELRCCILNATVMRCRTVRLRSKKHSGLLLINLYLLIICFFHGQVKIVAPRFFDMHQPALEASCHDIDQWPFPSAGQTLALPIMGAVIQVYKINAELVD